MSLVEWLVSALSYCMVDSSINSIPAIHLNVQQANCYGTIKKRDLDWTSSKSGWEGNCT